MRRGGSQIPIRVSTLEEHNLNNSDHSIETEMARRNAARVMIDKRVDQEMKQISPERTRCGWFGCFPRTFKKRSQNGMMTKCEPSNMEQRVFGKAVKATPAEAKLTEVIVQLQTLIAEQESKVARARAHARAAYKPGQDTQKNKEALQAMKRVKQMEKQMEGFQGQMAMVERQRDTLEESQMQKKLVAALSQSAKVMKANGPLVKQAEQVADSAVELLDQNEDITNALSQTTDDGDDDELLTELAQMMMTDEALGTTSEIHSNSESTSELAADARLISSLDTSLPSAPTKSAKSAKSTKSAKSIEHASLLAAA